MICFFISYVYDKQYYNYSLVTTQNDTINSICLFHASKIKNLFQINNNSSKKLFVNLFYTQYCPI